MCVRVRSKSLFAAKHAAQESTLLGGMVVPVTGGVIVCGGGMPLALLALLALVAAGFGPLVVGVFGSRGAVERGGGAV